VTGQVARCEIAETDLQRFRAAIVRRIGLQFDDAKHAFLSAVLQRRLDRLSCSSGNYLRRLEAEPSHNELSALAQELTVGETYFFRHNDQFRALAEVALPERMRARESCRALRLLSAGCASGEEAYSLAIVTQEAITEPSWNVVIRAVDLNPNVLEKAARARYSAWALREAPAQLQRKWFRGDSREVVVDESVRAAVQFDMRNLAGDDAELWQPSSYDVIFCRNVLMYFAPEQMRAVIGRIAQALAPGGYLFLGHAETLRGISDQFHLCHTHDAFYYRRKAPDATPLHQPDFARSIVAPAPSGATADLVLPTAWVDTIRQASERVATLVAAARTENTPTHASAWRLAPVFDLLRQERLDEALAYVCGGPSDSEADPDVLLVKAALLAQGGRLAGAQETCRRLLSIDELNAGAHYVLALCGEHSGECGRAMEHDRLAAHLDPGFAMPRMHCGLLARRAGDRNTARRELAQALVLLKREDVSRLVLFGGGFSRDALIALCQSAAAECAGRP
jgi:chemotaxis protein methyltransferase CheR